MKHPVSPRGTRTLVSIGWCWPGFTLTCAYAPMKNWGLVSSKRVPASGCRNGELDLYMLIGGCLCELCMQCTKASETKSNLNPIELRKCGGTDNGCELREEPDRQISNPKVEAGVEFESQAQASTLSTPATCSIFLVKLARQ